MTALIFPVVPDFSGAFWTVPGISTAIVLHQNGGRLHLDHWLKVQRARLVLELAGAVTALPPTGRAAGGER